MAERLANLAPNVRAQLILAFRNWNFVPPPATSNPTAGPGHLQRVVGAGNWRPITSPNGVMATGAEGIVHLWCNVDPITLLIRDRVVVKEVVSGSTRYSIVHNWVERRVGGEPLECHQANVVWEATAPADRQHIQACLGWGNIQPPNTAPAQSTYRYKLYHEYCAHKNLDKVMKILPRRKKAGAAKKGKRQFSEPFLWYMFESLAKACVGMDAAYTRPNGTSDGVVHQFPMYPVLKVADFGSARRIATAVVNRGQMVRDDPVCIAYAAPVGLIMASAMRRLNPLPENNWRDPLPGINYAIPPANQLHHDGAGAPLVGVHELTRAQLNPGPKKYSNALVDLVEHCLRHNNNNRPSAATLLQDIRLNADFQGMDTATLPLSAAQRKLCIELEDVRYAVNTIFQ
ncbi:hypothetical protein E4T44_03151 [Aureobasidium sp. EXF-8845]|nr:hypothetical protein E4T44_03151 [Aureobasidium sp. EXF-8845]KAI4854918.1 hypothetical protein E4T45_03653 [Aureobasidium sp. EXF-8846]